MPKFIRVRDKSTGHEYDVINVDPEAHDVLADYPPNDSPTAVARPAKHRLILPPAHPAGNATTEEWRDFAVRQGVPQDEADALGRDELRDRFTTPTQAEPSADTEES